MTTNPSSWKMLALKFAAFGAGFPPGFPRDEVPKTSALVAYDDVPKAGAPELQ